jgi:hypothetical protein
MSFTSRALVGASFALLVACGGASKDGVQDGSGSGMDGGSEGVDAGSSVDSSTGSATDASDSAVGTEADAAPRNATCTPSSQQTGTAVNTSHGRLDGTLVYVLAPENGYDNCNGDSSHVHLQVEVSGSVYDIAVDIGTAPNDEVGIYQESVTIPDGAWSEGWHSDGALSYKSLSLNSTNFPIQAPATIASAVESALESTSQISIFCTGYTQDNGCHDVHYENGTGNDGAIVLNPLAPTPTILFFRFQSDTFN